MNKPVLLAALHRASLRRVACRSVLSMCTLSSRHAVLNNKLICKPSVSKNLECVPQILLTTVAFCMLESSSARTDRVITGIVC